MLRFWRYIFTKYIFRTENLGLSKQETHGQMILIIILGYFKHVIYFNIQQTWGNSLPCIQLRRIQSPVKHLRWSFCENSEWFPIVNYFRKKLHLAILTRFWIHLCWSSYQRCSVRKGVLRILAKFTGKHLCHGLYFIKVAGLRPKACEFCEISENTIFTEHLWWLRLPLLSNS